MLRKPISEAGKAKLASLTTSLPLQGAVPPSFKTAESYSVLMNDCAVAEASSDKPVVGSPIATACLLIGLYDSSTKRAGCAHATEITEVSSLTAMLDFFSPADTVAHLAGGDESPELCLEVIDLLQKKGITIVNAAVNLNALSSLNPEDIDATINNGYSLAIDARNGALYSPVTFELEMRKDMQEKLALTAKLLANPKPTPLMLTYNGIKPSKKEEKRATETSFSGLKGGFLNNLPKDPKRNIAPTTDTALLKKTVEPSLGGLKAGFLLTPPPTKSPAPASKDSSANESYLPGIKRGFLNSPIK